MFLLSRRHLSHDSPNQFFGVIGEVAVWNRLDQDQLQLSQPLYSRFRGQSDQAGHDHALRAQRNQDLDRGAGQQQHGWGWISADDKSRLYIDEDSSKTSSLTSRPACVNTWAARNGVIPITSGTSTA